MTRTPASANRSASPLPSMPVPPKKPICPIIWCHLFYAVTRVAPLGLRQKQQTWEQEIRSQKPEWLVQSDSSRLEVPMKILASDAVLLTRTEFQ